MSQARFNRTGERVDWKPNLLTRPRELPEVS